LVILTASPQFCVLVSVSALSHLDSSESEHWLMFQICIEAVR